MGTDTDVGRGEHVVDPAVGRLSGVGVPRAAATCAKIGHSGASSGACGTALRSPTSTVGSFASPDQLGDPLGLGEPLLGAVVLEVRVREPHTHPANVQHRLQEAALLAAARTRQERVTAPEDGSRDSTAVPY